MREGLLGQIQGLKEKAAYHSDRLRRDYIPALQERKTTERIPPSIEKHLSPEQAEHFSDSIITPEQVERLNASIKPMQNGSYSFHEPAGNVKDGTRHVHEFIVAKSDAGTQLYYVDPEHTMGKSKNRNPLGIPRVGDLRPKVHVLYSAQLSPEGKVSHISILRYRAEVIPDHQHHLHTPKEQFQMAKGILENGELPEVLKGKENEVTFWMDFRPEGDGYKVSTQARSARDTQEIEKLFENLTAGQPMPAHDPLEGQIRRYQGIMRTYFPRHLEGNSFEPVK